MKFLIALLLAFTSITTFANTDSIDTVIEKVDAFHNKEIDCLTTALYYEARGESLKGQLAVAHVIFQRVDNIHFPNTICNVVYQTKPTVQFEWVKKTKVAPNNDMYKKLLLVSKKAFYVYISNKSLPCKNSLFFTSAKFNWKGIKQNCKIGNHTFYKKI